VCLFVDPDDGAAPAGVVEDVEIALSKKLVELHGGQIHVETEPSSGSRFVFTLPLEEA
jgi:light-regulated signal transduction histidine kinase (bacteriophytochrome)